MPLLYLGLTLSKIGCKIISDFGKFYFGGVSATILPDDGNGRFLDELCNLCR